jgi:CheY-like chemotaxis protein
VILQRGKLIRHICGTHDALLVIEQTARLRAIFRGVADRALVKAEQANARSRRKRHHRFDDADHIRTILLVDDSLEGLEEFRTLLELEGAQVSAEASAESALAAAADNEFDLILSDIGMPTMSGYELIAELRKLPSTSRVPAIALTGFSRDQDARRRCALVSTPILASPFRSVHYWPQLEASCLGNSFATCVAQIGLQYWRPHRKRLQTLGSIYRLRASAD